jgi:type IV secretion system protein VirB10
VTPKVDPETLALRAPPRPVTRLSRRMLIVATAAIAAVVMGVTLWSLRGDLRLPEVRPELHNVDRIARAENLDRLPPDYSKLEPHKPPDAPVPVLGKPFPGDLGAAMFKAEQAAAPPTAPASDPQGTDRSMHQREAEDAAKAPLFFRVGNQREAN